MIGINTGEDVFLEKIDTKTYKKICKIALEIGKADKTFKSTTEYFGKNPLRTTNLTYYVRDGYPDFCGQVNRKVPDGISIHFHDFFYASLLKELANIGIEIEVGDRFHMKPIMIKSA